MKKTVIWTSSVLVLGSILAFLLHRFVSLTPPLEVRVAVPEIQDIESTVTSNGKVIPIDNFQALAAISGPVAKIYVHVGEMVHKGQLLIQLSDPFAPSRYATASAALQSARSGDEDMRSGGTQEEKSNIAGDLDRARLEEQDAAKQLTLLQNLAASGAASPGEVDAAQHRLSAATSLLATTSNRIDHRYSKSEVTTSDARVKDAQASLETATAVLANANIVSPISGTVYSLPVAAYDFVNMGTVLLRVADLRKMQIRAYVDEPEIGHFALNEPVTVRWDARPDKLWHGHVTQVPLTVSNFGSRVVGECLIAIDDADGTLLPNTDVTVAISTAKRTNVLTIPRSALRANGTSRSVFRIVDSKLVLTPVQVGIVNLDKVEITGGLTPHDVVALSSMGIQDLQNGLHVKAIQ